MSGILAFLYTTSLIIENKGFLCFDGAGVNLGQPALYPAFLGIKHCVCNLDTAFICNYTTGIRYG